jgi:hypothetical protein
MSQLRAKATKAIDACYPKSLEAKKGNEKKANMTKLRPWAHAP